MITSNEIHGINRDTSYTHQLVVDGNSLPHGLLPKLLYSVLMGFNTTPSLKFPTVASSLTFNGP